MGVRFGLLGPLHVLDGAGAPVDVGGRQPRVVLAVLLAASGRPVSVDVLADAIWGTETPSSAVGTLQSYVSRLRRRFGDAAPLTWDDTGYRLDVPADQVDFRQFERLAEEGRRLLDDGEPLAARDVLQRADDLWYGPALGELADLEAVTGLATRLDELRVAAAEDRMAAELLLGRHAAVVGTLTELVAAHPLRERVQQQLALALYRSGRQADALRALAAAGRTLREELGIEPSRPLQDLEAAILAQDPALDAPAPRPTAAGRGPVPAAVLSPWAGPRLVGRDPELADVLTALDEAARDARFVVIEGEPGIGKTRLADEVRTIAAARGCVAVWGRSDEGGAAPALWPWLPPLRALAERAGGGPAILAELLTGDAPTALGQAAVLQFDRFEAVAELLEHHGGEQPAVVLLDDLQWADTTSLELLAFLAARLRGGVLVVGTVRQLEVGRNDAVTDALSALARRPGTRRLALRGLSAEDTAAVVGASSGRTLPPAVAATIHARADGNPFYAIELSRLLDDEGGVGVEVPGGVGDVIRRRLVRLPAATVELLGVAATVGRDVKLDLLAASADRPLDEVVDLIDPAVAHRLLVDVPEQPLALRFSHALVRQVLLDDLTSLRRARLHLKVADAIEAAGAGVDDAEIVAEHLWQAASVGVGRRAAQALERAAEVAIHRVSYSAAERLLVKAVQLRRATGTTMEDHEAELAAIVRLLEVARALRYFHGASSLEVLDRAKELAERCGQRDTLLVLLWFEWSALATSVRRAEADALAQAYFALTERDPDPGVRAGGHEVLGVLSWGAGRIADACEHLDRAMALVEEAPPPTTAFDAEKVMVTNTFWAFNHALRGDLSPADAFAHFDRMIAEAPDRFTVASICGFGATTAISLGCWDETDRYATMGVQADPGAQFSFWVGQARMQQGIVRARTGDVDGALRLFDEGKALYTGIGARSAVVTFEATLAMNVAEQGRLDDARRLVASARAELDTRHELWNAAVVLMAEATVAHAAGEADVAAERLKTAVEVATDQGAMAFVARAEALADALVEVH